MQNTDPQKERISGMNQYQPLQQLIDTEEEFNIREFFLKLYRRRMTIAGIFLLVAVITWLYLSQQIPRYTAQNLIVLEFQNSSLFNIDDFYTRGGWTSPSVIGTELDIIRSTSILEKVADKLKLERKPEFNPALVENKKVSHTQRLKTWLKDLWSGLFSFLGEEDPEAADDIPEELSPEEQEQRLRKGMVGRLLGGLQVENRRDSYTISISYTSQNPQVASQVANAVAEIYINDQLEAKFEATRRANEWLAQRLEGLRKELKSSEQAVKDLRQKSDMILTGEGTLLEQQIRDVNNQLIQARLKKSRAEAMLAQAREVMDRAGGIETLGEVLDSGNIQELRSEESSLRRKKAELSQRYGEKHPRMIQIDAEIRNSQDKIKEETNRVLKSLENKVHGARAEEQSLTRSLNQLKTQAGQAMQAELQLRELERQAKSSRTLYENYLSRFQETQEKDELQRPNARIISQAEVPSLPSHPRRTRTMALGLAAGLMFGIMGAYLLEALDRGFRTEEEVEQNTGLPVLGIFPRLGRYQGTPFDYVVSKPYSLLAESLRAFRTAIQLSNVDHPPKTIIVTSAIPKEGKSIFSLTFGRIAAMTGSRTLLLEADLMHPTLCKIFPNLEPGAGLEELLQGQAELEEAIGKDPETSLSWIMAHGKASTARGMLGSTRMQGLLEKLKESFDLIILDTPPIMGISDSWTLARNGDAVVLLFRWAETPRDIIKSALRQMKLLDIDVSGIVMSMVNIRQQSKYGYGGYSYYYRKYQKYYKK
ncbi:MAG: polysaccharide biosynthesis tyrosine autokinase [Desulfatiglandales bacterium]